MIALVLVKFVDLFVPIFVGVLVARIILSYILHPANRVLGWLVAMTDPVLGPVRKVVPPMAGFDFSPLVVVFGLQAVQWLVHAVAGI